MKWKKSRKEDTLNVNRNENSSVVQNAQNDSGPTLKTEIAKQDSIDNSKDIKKGKKKRNIIIFLTILIILLIVGGILFYVFIFKKNQSSQNDGMGDSNVQVERNDATADLLSASGTTSVGIVTDEIDLDYLDTDLLIEEVYVSNNSEVAAGDKILKITDDSLQTAQQELDNALEEAQLAYRAGVVSYQQAEIEAQYDYDSSILAGDQAQDVYDATVASLQSDVDDAQSDIDDLQDEMDDYTDGINGGYDDEYEVSSIYDKYQTDVQLLKDKVDEWGLGWSDVTGSGSSGGSSNSTYLSTAQSLYSEINEEYEEYKQAKSDYDDAMDTAQYGLQEDQLEMTTLNNALETAQNAYDEGIITAKQTYDETVATADIAQDTYDTAIKSAQEDVDSLEDDMDDAQDNLDDFNDTIGDGYMYAPTDGTIMHVDPEEGAYLNDYTEVLVYSDSSIMTVTATVDQSDINELTIGESATATIDDYGTFTGTITEINPVSSSTSQASVTYTVVVTLDGDVSDLEQNLTATVIFGMGGDNDGSTQETEDVSGNDVSGNSETTEAE